MACLHPISRINGWILTKLVHLYCFDMEKNGLDFGDLDPIFKVTQGLRLLKNGLSALYLLKEWMDFDQTCTTVLLWHEKELIRFWWPWSHFKVTGGLRLLENGFSASYLQMNGWILTKLVQLYCWDRDKLIRFWWPWPHFQGHRGLRLLENGLLAPFLINEWMDFD